MPIRTLSFTLLLLGVVAVPVRAGLLLSEICFNEVGSDTTGEWIEIYNTGPSAIDLSNYKIGDEETSGATSLTEAMYQFPAGAMINPGEVQVVAVSAARFQTVYGFLPTYETAGADVSVPDLTIYSAWDPDGGQINMSNSNDQAFILDRSDAIVDRASWGNTNAFDPAINISGNIDGQSVERIDPTVDTDTAADWQLYPATTATPTNQRSTPGIVVPEPGTLLLAIGGLTGLIARRRTK